MWLWNDKEFTSDDIQDYVAFVYKIINLENKRKYIGKKKFFKTRTKPPLKDQKRKRRVVTESDWQDYWGSNEELKADVERLGPEKFRREILYLCKTTGEASYYEAKIQFERNVLLEDEYYNGIINCRITARHLSKGKS